MAEPFLGEIRLFAANWAPKDWHLCDGAILPINGNQALFALLYNTYGGDGKTTFALPDLRGRMIVQPEDTFWRGYKGGAETVTLTEANLPPHVHATHGVTDATNVTNNPAGAVLTESPQNMYTTGTDSPVQLKTGSISSVGGGQGHNNMQPSLVLNYIISLKGIFPSRN